MSNCSKVRHHRFGSFFCCNSPDLWTLAALFLSVLCALPADGAVFVRKPGGRVRLSCGLPGADLLWYHQESLVVRVDGKTGVPKKGLDRFRPRAASRDAPWPILLVFCINQVQGKFIRGPR